MGTYYPHPGTMSDGAVVRELNSSCSRGYGWQLDVRLRNEAIEFAVAGTVFPFKSDGERYGRGQLPFYGDQHADVRRALRSGLVAMRRAQESKR